MTGAAAAAATAAAGTRTIPTTATAAAAAAAAATTAAAPGATTTTAATIAIAGIPAGALDTTIAAGLTNAAVMIKARGVERQDEVRMIVDDECDVKNLKYDRDVTVAHR